jgi:dTMP kinase
MLPVAECTARLIALDGADGCGKSTNLQFIAELIRSNGYDVITSREPGGTPLGETLRSIVLNPAGPSIHVDSELLLMFAARAQHLHQLIYPALQRGCWVITDRFTDATYAYQGGGRGIPERRIAELEHWVMGDFRADLSIYLDISPEIAQQRIADRQQLDRFDAESADFQQRVRASYRQRAAQYPHRFVVINADEPLHSVQQSIALALNQRFFSLH